MRHGPPPPPRELRRILERLAALAKEARQAEYPYLAARILDLYTETARRAAARGELAAPPVDVPQRRASDAVSQAG